MACIRPTHLAGLLLLAVAIRAVAAAAVCPPCARILLPTTSSLASRRVTPVLLADTNGGDEFPPVDQIIDVQRKARVAARTLSEAVAREDYSTAKVLKQQLEALRAADPIYVLRKKLNDALAAEDYAAALSAKAALSRLRVERDGLLWRDEVVVLASGGTALHVVDPRGVGTSEHDSRQLYTPPSGYVLAMPTWSPDGESIALSEVSMSPSTTAPSRVIVVSARDGTILSSAPTPPVFFIYWSPDGNFVTFLHAEPNANAGGPPIVLGALDVSAKAARYVCPGGPLYYAIGRSSGDTDEAEGMGSEGAAPTRLPPLLLNNGFLQEVAYAESLGDGKRTSLSEEPATFRAPCLISLGGDGTNGDLTRARQQERAVFVDGGGVIVAVDLATRERSVLHTLSRPGGGVLLVAAPDGRSLAVMAAPETEAVEPELLLFRAPSAEKLVEGEELEVLPLEVPRGDGVPRALPLCFFFSPDSTRLLCLDALVPSAEGVADGGFDSAVTVSDLPASVRINEAGSDGRLRVMWSVFETRRPAASNDATEPALQRPVRRSCEPFLPSATFLRQYVPFFDQYAQAVSPWSPDSLSFCYTTADGSVMLQRIEADEGALDEGEVAVPGAEEVAIKGVASADVALWSPC